MSRMELNMIQAKLKTAIQNHQLLVVKMKGDNQNVALKKGLLELQEEIKRLSEEQKKIVVKLRESLVKSTTQSQSQTLATSLATVGPTITAIGQPRLVSFPTQGGATILPVGMVAVPIAHMQRPAVGMSIHPANAGPLSQATNISLIPTGMLSSGCNINLNTINNSGGISIANNLGGIIHGNIAISNINSYGGAIASIGSNNLITSTTTTTPSTGMAFNDGTINLASNRHVNNHTVVSAGGLVSNSSIVLNNLTNMANLFVTSNLNNNAHILTNNNMVTNNCVPTGNGTVCSLPAGVITPCSQNGIATSSGQPASVHPTPTTSSVSSAGVVVTQFPQQPLVQPQLLQQQQQQILQMIQQQQQRMVSHLPIKVPQYTASHIRSVTTAAPVQYCSIAPAPTTAVSTQGTLVVPTQGAPAVPTHCTMVVTPPANIVTLKPVGTDEPVVTSVSDFIHPVTTVANTNSAIVSPSAVSVTVTATPVTSCNPPVSVCNTHVIASNTPVSACNAPVSSTNVKDSMGQVAIQHATLQKPLAGLQPKQSNQKQHKQQSKVLHVKQLTSDDQEKKKFLEVLDLYTSDALIELLRRRNERKRRTTANPNYSFGFEISRRDGSGSIWGSSAAKKSRARGKVHSWSDSTSIQQDVISKKMHDNHEDYCAACGKGGQLLMCETCRLVYHLDCLSPPLTEAPTYAWSCPKCLVSGRGLLHLNSEALAKVNSYIAKKAAKEEEKKKCERQNRELNGEKNLLEKRSKQLDEKMKEETERQLKLMSQENKRKEELSKLSDFVRVMRESRTADHLPVPKTSCV
ncbi:unnamed protein product [Lymnaea stagnalis]|uniref:PHD-type domain-containing protein n=1 Tax=Lymnaea stagnalis TaxID=6523 RepID=A0AAV2I7Y0_LYMST